MPTWIAWAQKVLAKDWFLCFLSGVAATVLGFVLTIGWDVYKCRRDTREKEDTILRALSEEMVENKTIVDRDANLLQQELAVLAEQKAVVRPLSVLKVGFWDIAKINLPKALLRNDRLLKLRNVAALADDCNEQIRSRENYRINNGAMSNFSQRMRIYDEPLVQSLAELKTAIDEYERAASGQ
ncbi:MAG: hypothetical protein IMZ71_04910 [Chloroflexi bacterium]|nr:hypothetical protein [Chloroflexota bacterium]